MVEADPGLPKAVPTERARAIAAISGSDGAGKALALAIENDLSFGALRSGWFALPGGFGMSIRSSAIANRLLDGVIIGNSAKSLIDEARAFAASPICTVESYTPIAGATVAQVIDLGDSTQLVPWVDVPEDDRKKVFDVGGPHVQFLETYPIVGPNRATANMAARISFAKTRVLFTSQKEAHDALVDTSKAMLERKTRIQDAIRCITLESRRCAADLGGWMRLYNEVANELIVSGYHSSGLLYDSAVYVSSQDPIALDPNSFASLLRGFEGFKGAHKDSLRVCADRFNQALSQSNAVNKAIDLGIAIESLLLHGIGPRDRGELKYRLSVRGATFLGGSKEERLKTFNLLRATYDLRSQAVHAGALTTKKNAPSPNETLEQAAAVCSHIAKQLIERGSFPDWEADCVFGA